VNWWKKGTGKLIARGMGRVVGFVLNSWPDTVSFCIMTWIIRSLTTSSLAYLFPHRSTYRNMSLTLCEDIIRTRLPRWWGCLVLYFGNICSLYRLRNDFNAIPLLIAFNKKAKPLSRYQVKCLTHLAQITPPRRFFGLWTSDQLFKAM